MSLPHALLTSLIEKPCSGLELSSQFDRSIGFYWHATHQQIYRELARLEAAGWAESTPIEASRGRKKEYRVTAAGRKELRRWAGEARGIEPVRSELMIRMRAEATLGSSGVEAEIERLLAAHRGHLTTLRKLEEHYFSDPAPSRSTAITHLILAKGIMNELTWIDWLVQAQRVLARDEPPVQRA